MEEEATTLENPTQEKEICPPYIPHSIDLYRVKLDHTSAYQTKTECRHHPSHSSSDCRRLTRSDILAKLENRNLNSKGSQWSMDQTTREEGNYSWRSAESPSDWEIGFLSNIGLSHGLLMELLKLKEGILMTAHPLCFDALLKESHDIFVIYRDSTSVSCELRDRTDMSRSAYSRLLEASHNLSLDKPFFNFSEDPRQWPPARCLAAQLSNALLFVILSHSLCRTVQTATAIRPSARPHLCLSQVATPAASHRQPPATAPQSRVQTATAPQPSLSLSHCPDSHRHSPLPSSASHRQPPEF
nr:hypothetical protein Iba_chr08bCG6000 [Ipomoea batatas]